MVSGPVPTTIVTTLVMADVELAAGLVDSTLSLCSADDADGDCWNFWKPAVFSLVTHSAYVAVAQSGTSACCGPVDTLMVIWSSRAADVFAAGSVPITSPTGTSESGC